MSSNGESKYRDLPEPDLPDEPSTSCFPTVWEMSRLKKKRVKRALRSHPDGCFAVVRSSVPFSRLLLFIKHGDRMPWFRIGGSEKCKDYHLQLTNKRERENYESLHSLIASLADERTASPSVPVLLRHCITGPQTQIDSGCRMLPHSLHDFGQGSIFYADTLDATKGHFSDTYKCKIDGYSGEAVVKVTWGSSGQIHFNNEWSFVRRFRHENIAYCYGKTEYVYECCRDNRYGIVLEFAKHGSLLDFVKKSPPDKALGRKIAKDIASAMKFLAEAKIVHRDLAARNILIFDNFVAKVTDFGHAIDLHENGNKDGLRLGPHPKWAAPEILRTGCTVLAAYSEKSDVYSYGMVLVEMMTAREPYKGIPAAEICKWHETGSRPRQFNHLDPLLNGIYYQSVSESPKDRPTFEQISADLSGGSEGEGVSSNDV